ncbi:glycosyltransferase family 1 protein [Ramaria rubella]|nr:glycosyltransferase family 1 protein [Ramaria rubella]
MEAHTKFSGHVALVGFPAWGHLRPLCSFACKIVKEQPGIAVTFLVVGAFGPRVESEISRYFSEPESKAKEHIRIVNVGGEGFDPLTLMPLIMQKSPVYYEKMINNEPLQCLATGKTFGAIQKPNAAVIDFVFLPILQAFRAQTGKRIPIFGWQTTCCSVILRIMGPEKFGGMGNIASIARKQAEATGGQYEAILEELYRPATGNLITVPGLPPMYDYEWSPQEPRKDLPRGLILDLSCIFARECDGFVAVSSPVYEAGSLNAMRAWFAETNRPFYAVGPLMPPGAGGAGLSESSKKVEAELSENGDEFQIFLDKTLNNHGQKSIIYVSFGSIWWPHKNEYVWVFVDALMELGVPFILSHPAKEAQAPKGLADKVKQSGLGLLSKWCPQQTILNHPATGWILTHCGQNSVTEALTQGIPMIAWPIDADQPANAAHLTLDLDVAFELIEGRTGHGLKPLHRGVTPKGTIEAVAAEARDIIRRALGPEGARKRKNAEKLRDDMRKEWEEGGNALKNLREFLDDLGSPK